MAGGEARNEVLVADAQTFAIPSRKNEVTPVVVVSVPPFLGKTLI